MTVVDQFAETSKDMIAAGLLEHGGVENGHVSDAVGDGLDVLAGEDLDEDFLGGVSEDVQKAEVVSDAVDGVDDGFDPLSPSFFR